jgi:hypothetical protein
MKRFIGIIIVTIMVGVLVSLNTINSKPGEVTLSNIAALSVAQAEDGDTPYCALISTDLCYINTNTIPVTVIYGLLIWI